MSHSAWFSSSAERSRPAPLRFGCDRVRSRSVEKLSQPQKRRRRLQREAVRKSIIAANSVKTSLGLNVQHPSEENGREASACEVFARLDRMQHQMLQILHLLAKGYMDIPADSDGSFNDQTPGMATHCSLNHFAMACVPEPLMVVPPPLDVTRKEQQFFEATDDVTSQLAETPVSDDGRIQQYATWQSGQKNFVKAGSRTHEELREDAALLIQRRFRYRQLPVDAPTLDNAGHALPMPQINDTVRVPCEIQFLSAVSMVEEKFVKEKMKVFRGTWPVWPPLTDHSEDEGCNRIIGMLRDAAQEMVVESIGPLNDQQTKHLLDRIDIVGRKGLDDWKRFAQARPCSSSSPLPDLIRPAKIKKKIDEPHPPRRRRNK